MCSPGLEQPVVRRPELGCAGCLRRRRLDERQQEIPIPEDVTELLVQGERAVAAYKTFRDSAIFTTRRLIVRDAQGIRGKKIEIYSLPYSAINMWSSENARGVLDRNGEIELWTRAGHIKVSLAKGIDVRRLDRTP